MLLACFHSCFGRDARLDQPLHIDFLLFMPLLHSYFVFMQVRYDKRVGTSTALKFMTDGILLREVQEDFLLRKYSALVVDEAHERSLNTDILLGMLSRIVTLRRSMAAQSAASGGTAASSDSVQPLKLIVMSATLRTEDFVSNQRLFPQPPPVVSVPARQYPVTVHFSKRTEVHDYVGAAYKKVCQIHRNLPPGGVLVFLTGQREVEYLCRKLRKTFATRKAKQAKHGELETPADLEEGEAAAGDWSGGDAAEADAGAAADEAMLLAALEDDRSAAGEAVDDYADESSGDEEEVVVMGGDGFSPEEIAEAENKFSALLGVGGPNGAQIGAGGEEGGQEEAEPAGRVLVLPLYAMLPPAQQALVFKPPPEGHRLIVVATNVAETSLTIPGVRYVVDAGRSKQKLLESAAGLSRFEVRWVSKASAEQRAGRAGRTGPGHCYRLYSSAHFNDTFPQHSPPEVVNTALEGVTLMLKSLGVDKVANFPFPSPPEASGLRAAERCLVALGALDPGSKKLTHAGKEMARFPISPRHARMLLQALEVARSAGTAGDVDDVPHGKKGKKKSGKSIDPGVLLQYAAALAAVLSVESPFVSISNMAAEEKVDDEADPRNDGSAQGGSKADDAAVKEERKRQLQSAREAHARFRTADSDALSALRVLCAFEAAGEVESFCRDNFLHFRNLREAAALRKQLSKLIVTQQQVKEVTFALSLTAPPSPPPVVALEALRRALAAGWCDQVARRVRSVEHIKSRTSDGKKGRAVRYRSCALEEDVFLHPNSALHASAPELVTYTELVRTVKRPYMAGVTAIEPQWLSALAAPMCTFSAPLIDPAPFYSVTADAVLAWREVTFGQYDWPLPRHAAPHPELSERAATFAAALLEGKILPSMAALRAAMAVPPSMAARPDMRMHKRVAELLAALERAHVDSKAALAAQWRRNPEFLKREMAQWLQKGGAGVLESVWHSLLRESGAVAE